MSAMRFIFSYPGVMEHAQQAALSLHEAGSLEAFATSFVFKETSLAASLVKALPLSLSGRALSQLRRRTISDVPAELLWDQPMLEILRTLLQKAGAGAVSVDRMWDFATQHFDRQVANHLVPRADGVMAFEYAALASFQRAEALGRARVLHLPSLDSAAFHAIEEREKVEWPELRRPDDAYFQGRFEARQARRQAEVALADVIITNSSLTKRSHVEAGAKAEKVFVATLAAPPPRAAPVDRDSAWAEPLQVIWSGSFILRKGAHYLIDAWRRLGAGADANLDVYGHVGIPERLLSGLPNGLQLRGSVPRAAMMGTYDAADVLVFPTLSDGFGMAVTEALSRGVPVITTDQAGAADLIEHGRNGLVVPAGDAAALEGALRWCLENRPALSAMRSAALDTARARQWVDYRRDHMLALAQGLRQAGYNPGFDLPANAMAR